MIETTARPINATELRSLKEIVACDFQSLRAELIRYKLAEVDRRVQLIKKKYATIEQDCAKATKDVQTFNQKYQDQLRVLYAKWAEKGVKPKRTWFDGSGPHYLADTEFWSDVITKEIAQANVDVQALYDQALNMLQVKEFATKRGVLVASLEGQDALSLLASIPDVKTLMAEAKKVQPALEAQ